MSFIACMAHQLIGKSLLSFFNGGIAVASCLFLRLLSSDSCYDLDIWAQSQAFKAFLCVPNIFAKSMRGILIKHIRNVFLLIFS